MWQRALLCFLLVVGLQLVAATEKSTLRGTAPTKATAAYVGLPKARCLFILTLTICTQCDVTLTP